MDFTQCTRARVAIDVPNALSPSHPVDSPVLHIGHARTLLLGSLIAEELGLPLHIRLDGGGPRDLECTAGVLLPVCTMISHLGIKCALAYRQPLVGPSDGEYASWFGSRGPEMKRAMWFGGNDNPILEGMLADDLLFNYPSLIIRGMEFSDESLTSAVAANQAALARRVAIHRWLAELMGRTWYEINVPLITDGGKKVSKSLQPALNWTFFERFEPPLVRDFLVATALAPRDPLAVVGQTFWLDAMSVDSYEWDWNTWDEYIREATA